MKNQIFCLIIVSLLSLIKPVFAEETLQKQTESMIPRVADASFLTLNVENDMFAGGGDQNYTSGVSLRYFDLGKELPGFVDVLDRMVPTFTINKTTSFYYTVGHNLYTPKVITSPVLNVNDRPWAAFLYGAAGLATITNDHIDELEATIGMVGPAALGEPVQRFVHKVVDSPRPMGWDHQLQNEPGLMLSWQRRWPERYGMEVLGLTAAVEPHVGVTLGNIYTYSNAGLGFRLSPFSGRWQDDPIRVRPAMPGTGAFVVPEDKWSWHIFGGLEGRAVGRNIFLDGNTFRDSHDVDKKNFVADANMGIAVTYGRTRLSYTQVYRTREFETQEGADVFGTISLGYRF